ncbi:hypothetical protein [Pseudomonas viridiflava]|uniref:hypothetical protein n=1 Tax=Pseudomonas viridiflava TaxID=33069 RepID=UPI002EAB493F|nr:hypothetical protein [Pseudomonas viridiflava]
MPYIPLPSYQVILEARTYLKSALLIERSGDTALLGPACVLAGFSMELLLKSFMAKDASVIAMKVDSYDIFSGAISSERGHNLGVLFDKIDARYRQAIIDTSEKLQPGFPLEQKLREYADYFFHGRYGYEPGSIGIFHLAVFDCAEHLERVCTELLPTVVQPHEL